MDARTLDDLMTPAAVVDLPRMTANLDRMAAYAAEHELHLRPHTKTHKTPELAGEQLRRGAAGVTVATVHEAEVMSGTVGDVLMAYPPVGRQKLDRLMALPDDVRVTVALDSNEALEGIALAAAAGGRTIGVLVEVDLGMRRVGVASPAAALALARRAADASAIDYRGILFYPGHIRQRVEQQDGDLESLTRDLAEVISTLTDAGLAPGIVSGGSTPTAFASHRVGGLTEMRPGTYIFNDRTTAEMGACDWEDCAYTVLATVVSTAVAGQAVVDAGSKALTREELRAAGASGLGAVLDHPEVVVRTMSEEHGVLDITGTDWRPRVGDRVRIVPNHVCVSVNMHNRLWAVEGDEIRTSWRIAARNWAD